MIFLVSLITAAYVGLGVRLVDIQVFQHEKHAAHAEDNTSRKVIHAFGAEIYWIHEVLFWRQVV